MTVVSFQPKSLKSLKLVDEQRAREFQIAREAFRRGLKIGASLGYQQRKGFVEMPPARVSAAGRLLERGIQQPSSTFARHAYVVVFMAAVAAFLVFVCRL